MRWELALAVNQQLNSSSLFSVSFACLSCTCSSKTLNIFRSIENVDGFHALRVQTLLLDTRQVVELRKFLGHKYIFFVPILKLKYALFYAENDSERMMQRERLKLDMNSFGRLTVKLFRCFSILCQTSLVFVSLKPSSSQPLGEIKLVTKPWIIIVI